MGKHNGKARKSGLSVGSALVNRAKRDGRTGLHASTLLYTTDNPGNKGGVLQSCIESNDLQEMMSMAELAERDFAAERTQVVVIHTGASTPLDAERAAAERADAEARHAHRLRIPRRPSWDASTSAEQLDAQERASFLDWRRDLALLETDERLILTPFEKNLEVWRQLWRVVERSDIVVQVVDSRDPLTYRSEDLELYCREVHAAKGSFLLLNKADLLPERIRVAWADYFDGLGAKYAFWSAKAAAEQQEMEQREAEYGEDAALQRRMKLKKKEDPRARLLSIDELMDLFQREAEAAVVEAASHGLPRASRGERFVVGLTGYPNVGKSSTINALFGSKKTAVAATPGKTKHFQTLNVCDELCICDCPGLVMPQFAHSKAEMVAAGVIPIDRLTDVRAPVGAVANRVSRKQLEEVYALNLPTPTVAEDPDRPPTAAELLRALALSRGWVSSSGLPDETRAGRKILKDFVDGRVLACNPPPDASEEIIALADEIAGRRSARNTTVARSSTATDAEDVNGDSNGAAGPSSSGGAGGSGDSNPGEDAGNTGTTMPPVAPGTDPSAFELDEADLDLFDSVNLANGKPKPMRAAHKFHKKAARTKGRQTVAVETERAKDRGYDGATFGFGKRGGLVRVPVPVPSSDK